MAGLHQIKPNPGSRKRAQRVGRGIGSGWGKTSKRGHKGQSARSGARMLPGFEGGQMPLHRRVPKRGFSNAPFQRRLAAVNVAALNRFADDTVVTPELLRQHGLVKGRWDGVKVLGEGELERKLVVQAQAFSRSAVTKIEAAGGKAEVV